MQIPIVISPDFTKFSVLKEAVSEVNEIQTAFELSIVKQEWVPDTAKKTSIDSPLIFSMASKEMTESRICVVVQRRVNVDWFSDYRPHAYLISTSDWDAKYAPPSLRVYLIFMFACGLPWLACSLPTEVADSTVHDPNIGCISDYCGEKATIKDCMREAHICDDCKRIMKKYGLFDHFLLSTEQILTSVRNSMVAYDADSFCFLVGERFRMEEGRYVEFKAAQGDPLNAIEKYADEYAVAMLNDKGGDIFWGISDDDGVVLGLKLTARQRDEIRRAVSQQMTEITPPVTRMDYRLEFYKTENSNELNFADRWIVRLNVSQGSPFELYATKGRDVFMKTEGGRKRLTHMQVIAEIKRRHQLEIGS